MSVPTLYEFWSESSESQRQSMVSGIRGCVEYGTTVTWNLLPEAGRQRVSDEYSTFIEGHRQQLRDRREFVDEHAEDFHG